MGENRLQVIICFVRGPYRVCNHRACLLMANGLPSHAVRNEVLARRDFTHFEFLVGNGKKWLFPANPYKFGTENSVEFNSFRRRCGMLEPAGDWPDGVKQIHRDKVAIDYMEYDSFSGKFDAELNDVVRKPTKLIKEAAYYIAL